MKNTKNSISLVMAVVIIISMALFTVAPLAVNAADDLTEGDFTYRVDNNEAEITDFNAAFSGDVIVPSTLGGYPVARISSLAFQDCTEMTGITIPSSVTYIGDGIFKGCTKLASITVDENNEDYYSAGNCIITREEVAYTVVAGCKTSVIPDDNSIDIIDRMAFAGCTELTEIKIPSSVAMIDSEAFSGCSKLEKISIPSDILAMADDAFENCGALVYNEYENGKYLGNDENKYVALVDVTDTAVTKFKVNGNTEIFISGGAFYNCNNLSDIEIPDSVRSIGQNFNRYEFPNLVEKDNGIYYVDKWMIGIDYNEMTSFSLRTDTIGIGAGAVGYCDLTSVTIPSSVKYIDHYAFANSEELQSVNFAANSKLERIGVAAFMNCTELASISIPKSVTNIDSSAFVGCSKLKEVNITDMEAWCRIKFKELGMPPGNPLWYAQKLCLNGKTVTELDIPKGITDISRFAFVNSKDIKSITMHEGLKTIGRLSFAYCSGLTSVMLPDGVTSLGYGAFGVCNNLESILIPKSVTSIGEYAFAECDKLTIYCYEGSAAHTYAVGNNIPFVLVKANTQIPTAPVVESKTETSVTLAATEGYEYKMGDGIWQSSNVFEGLTANTTYTFYQRIAASFEVEASAVSEKLEVTTLSAQSDTADEFSSADEPQETVVLTESVELDDAENNSGCGGCGSTAAGVTVALVSIFGVGICLKHKKED